jgi:cytochrome c-type biogenesis protein CcmH
MKLLINKKIDEGYNEKEIYDFLEKKYGKWIVYDPGFNKKTFILWLLPILLFLTGGVIIFKKLIVKK